MAEKYSIDEIGAMMDRIERKLDLILHDPLKGEHSMYDFECPRVFDCGLAGKYCWLCRQDRNTKKRMGNF